MGHKDEYKIWNDLWAEKGPTNIKWLNYVNAKYKLIETIIRFWNENDGEGHREVVERIFSIERGEVQ